LHAAYVTIGELREEVAALREHSAAEQPATPTPTPSTEQKAVEFVRDLSEHGIRFDLNPTVDSRTLAASYVAYIGRIDQSIRERASAALVSPVSDQPTPLDPLPYENRITGTRYPDREVAQYITGQSSPGDLYSFDPQPGYCRDESRYEQGGDW
jgi:hypothetical protein